MSDPLPLRRNPGFARLWSARVVSRFGSSLSYVVLLWVTYATTGSALAVAYVGLAEFLPTVVFGVFAGTLVDRFDRRRVIVASTLGRAAAMGGLIVALELLGFHLALVLLASAVFSVCATFFGPGSQALLPELVGPSDLATANGLFDSSESAVGIAGSAAAGALILSVGAVPSLGVDVACYVAGALAIAAIASAQRPSIAPPGARSVWADVRQGWQYLRRAAGLFQVTLVSIVINFLFSVVLTFLVVYARGPLHGSALVYGSIEALLAAGWGVGGLAVGRLGWTRHAGTLWIVAAIVEGTAVLLLVVAPELVVALPVFLGVGVVQGLVNVATMSSTQAIVPPDLQGRYFATDTMLSYASIPASQILGGVIIAERGILFAFTLVGVASLAAGVAFLGLRPLRRFGYGSPEVR